MLGEKFRELRKQQGISIIKASEGITSASSLQRWENNKGEMSIEKVINLLNRINIRPNEFLAKAGLTDLNIIEAKIRKAYQESDLKELEKIANSLLTAHDLQPKNQDLLIKAAIACNYYMDLSNKNLFPQNDALQLRKILNSMKYWNQTKVSIFGNSILILPVQDIQEISHSLLGYLIYQDNTHTFHIMAVNTLINAVVSLLKAKQPRAAYKLLTELNHLHLPERYSNEIIKIKFFNSFFEYLETGDKYIMDSFFHNLSALWLTKQIADFKLGLSQLEEIYSPS